MLFSESLFIIFIITNQIEKASFFIYYKIFENFFNYLILNKFHLKKKNK